MPVYISIYLFFLLSCNRPKTYDLNMRLHCVPCVHYHSLMSPSATLHFLLSLLPIISLSITVPLRQFHLNICLNQLAFLLLISFINRSSLTKIYFCSLIFSNAILLPTISVHTVDRYILHLRPNKYTIIKIKKCWDTQNIRL